MKRIGPVMHVHAYTPPFRGAETLSQPPAVVNLDFTLHLEKSLVATMNFVHPSKERVVRSSARNTPNLHPQRRSISAVLLILLNPHAFPIRSS